MQPLTRPSASWPKQWILIREYKKQTAIDLESCPKHGESIARVNREGVARGDDHEDILFCQRWNRKKTQSRFGNDKCFLQVSFRKVLSAKLLHPARIFDFCIGASVICKRNRNVV